MSMYGYGTYGDIIFISGWEDFELARLLRACAAPNPKKASQVNTFLLDYQDFSQIR